MLDVDDYGVVALDLGALTAITGGNGGCQELAYAIGYGFGWLAHKAMDAADNAEAFLIGTGLVTV